jgi:hypothetical protein
MAANRSGKKLIECYGRTSMGYSVKALVVGTVPPGL